MLSGSGCGRFLPVSSGRCGRWRDHRQVIDGILHARYGRGCSRRDLPERFGPWKTVYERHRLWSADGILTAPWEHLLQQVQAAADAAGEIDWDISVDSTIVRAHQHAAGARTDPTAGARVKRGGNARNTRTKGRGRASSPAWSEVVLEVRAWADRAAGSPASSHPERGRPLPPAVPDRHRRTTSGLHAVHSGAGEDPRPTDRPWGRPRRRPDSLTADKAYSNGPCREYLRRRGIRHVIPEN